MYAFMVRGRPCKTLNSSYVIENLWQIVLYACDIDISLQVCFIYHKTNAALLKVIKQINFPFRCFECSRVKQFSSRYLKIPL